jgi:dienelactone hydrolase
MGASPRADRDRDGRTGTEAIAMPASPVPRSSAPAALALAAAAALLLAFAPLAAAKGKDKAKEPPKTGLFQLAVIPPAKYIQMGVPADYDPARHYPLLFLLHPSDSKPDDFVGAWWEILEKKGWIVAGPAFEFWDNEESIKPLESALAKVKETYRIDDRRIVLVGHNAGANMAWRMATRVPEAWAAVIAVSGEITEQDRPQLKKIAGKPVYIFRGAKDTQSYTVPMFERDKKMLEAWKVPATFEVRPDWGFDFPKPSLPAMFEWMEKVWPPGAYRERAEAVDQALLAKDVPAATKAHEELVAELRKNPYPAFDPRVLDLQKAIVALGRSLIADAKALVEASPLDAITRMEAAVKAVKGLKPVDAEAAAALAALKKDPKVVAAVQKKEAEAKAVTYIERADAAEAKGDLAKALEWFRKVVALGDTSKKAEADAKVAELEPKVGGK